MRHSSSKLASLAAAALVFASATQLYAHPALLSVDTTPPTITTAPSLAPNPNTAVPLVATITLTTNELTQIALTISDGVRIWNVLAEPNYRTVHRVLVLGVHPNVANTIRVTARDQAGNLTTWPTTLTFVTPPLPASFPPMTTTASFPTRMEPGVTLFQARFTSPQGPQGPAGTYMIMLDSAGEVIWFLEASYDIGLVTRMRNGHLLAIVGGFVPGAAAVEMDMLGNAVRTWSASGLASPPPGTIPVATHTFHHELRELPENEVADFLTLSTEIRVYPNYPADEVNTSNTTPTANVIGDKIVEFKRDGTIVRETKLLDVLDPYRIVYGSLATFYNTLYPGSQTKDWGHGNAVLLDQSDNTYVMSLRHQDAVVKIKRDTGQLVWICGPHERWNAPWSNYLLTPVGSPFEWNYHQHDPEINRLGNIVMFDNGNYRVTPPTPPGPTSSFYSRAVEYDIDATSMTIEQKWFYGGPTQPFYSGFLGGAKPQYRTGNTLVTDGAKVLASQAARIVEVMRTNPAIVVFETTLQDPSASVNWTVYRSERLPGIYPHTWLPPTQH